MAAFLKQCHFKFCSSISKVTIYVPTIFHCLASPGKVSAVACKAKRAWIKRSIHYVTLPHPGELLKEIPPYLRRDFWYKRCTIWKWHCLWKNFSRIKTPSSKVTILVSSCWKTNFIPNNVHNFFILSLVFLKLLIASVAFFLGHPV